MSNSQDEIDSIVDELKYGHPETRKKAAIKLGRIRDHRVIPHLIKAMKDDEYSYTRVSAIQSLLWIADPSIIPEIISVAINDKDNLVRRTAIEGLGSLKNGDTLQALREILKDEPDEEIREIVNHTIQKIIQQ